MPHLPYFYADANITLCTGREKKDLYTQEGLVPFASKFVLVQGVLGWYMKFLFVAGHVPSLPEGLFIKKVRIV